MDVSETRRAYVGCFNWALGEIMHTLKYPNPVSCDNKELYVKKNLM